MQLRNLFNYRTPENVLRSQQLLHALLSDRFHSLGYTKITSRSGRELKHMKSHNDPHVTTQEANCSGITKEQYVYLSGTFIAERNKLHTFKSMTRLFMACNELWLPHFVDVEVSEFRSLGRFAFIFEDGNPPMERNISCVRISNPVPELFGLARPKETTSKKISLN